MPAGTFDDTGLSAFSGRIGERGAAEGVTVVDDGTIADRRGSLNVDDEGTVPGRKADASPPSLPPRTRHETC